MAPNNPQTEAAPPATNDGAGSAERGVKIAFALALAAVGFGHICLWLTRLSPYAEINSGPRGYFNIFWVLSVQQEPLALSIILIALTVGYWLTLIRRVEMRSRAIPRGLIAVLAVLTLAGTWLGTKTVYLDFPLSMDEFTMDFQAQIFARGQLAADVPEALWPYVNAIKSPFVDFHAANGTWASSYLPVYSALRAATLTIHPKLLLNPLLAALSIFALAAIARRLWPGRPAAGPIAVALLFTSSQFLVTSMSFYPLAAHLAFNLVWLWLYLRDDRLGWALLPFVGALAMGLHQFVNHAIFAAPFLLRVVLDRRWSLGAWLASSYAAFLALWVAWMNSNRLEGVSDIAGFAWGLPRWEQWLHQGLSWTQALSWQMPFAMVLIALAAMRFRTLPVVVKDAAFSVLITGGFFLTYLYNQGHGWGYRYVYPALGCLILVMTAGVFELFDRLGHGRARTLLAIGFAASLLLIPVRLLQTHSVILPFHDATEHLRQFPNEAVMFDGNSLWYGRDLVRNDPFFERTPLIFDTAALFRRDLAPLQNTYDIGLEIPATFERFGMPVTTSQPSSLSVRGEPISRPQPQP